MSDGNPHERLASSTYALTGDAADNPIESAIDVLRWGSIALSVLVVGLRATPMSALAWVATIGIIVYAIFRTWRPILPEGQIRVKARSTSLAAEIGVHVVAVALTELWFSALLYPLITSVIVTGLVAGRNFALLGAVGAAAPVTLLTVLMPDGTDDILQRSAASTATLLLAALMAGHGYRLLGGDNEYPPSSRLRRLSNANRLLADLHDVSKTLPSSLDHQEVLQTSITRLRGILKFDSAAIFIVDHQTGSWETVHRVSMPVDQTISETELPEPARRAVRENRLVHLCENDTASEHFLSSSTCSMYAPLLARGKLVGLLAIESSQPEAFSRENEETLEGFVVPLGLAVDNAQLFNKIRSDSLNEERTRIARHLHDSLGQSLAHLGFELDRVMVNNDEGIDISGDLTELRQQIKLIVGQQRDALHDLRSDVNEQKDLAQTIEEFAARLADREQLAVSVHSDTKSRLPIRQEREMWRITQEALINAGRHADASEVNVYWSCTKSDALLEVVDNGRGLHPEYSQQLGSYGIIGMRERAANIGATFDLISKPNQGTKVRCYLNRN